MSSGSRPTARLGYVAVSSAGSPIPGSDGDPAASAPRASEAVGAAVIVGRDSELARLGVLRDAAFAGQAGTALIGGEAGVGKTSLTNAFVTSTRQADPSVLVLRGECVPLGGEGLPYAPVVGLLHDLAGQLGENELLELAGAGAAELRWLIPEFGAPAEPVDGTRPENRLRLFETISRLFTEAARRAPLIIVVEDLHWADDSSRHLIEFLIRSITDVPVLIMISYRTDELTRRHPLRPFLAEIGRVPSVHRLEIGPLDDAAVEQLISLTCHPDDQQPGLIKRLAMASGIPFFVIELIRASGAGGDVPETLRDTLLLRISRVGDECQRLLRLMAVGGIRVEHNLIAAVWAEPEDRLEQILRQATEANLLVPDKSGYAFRHALMREVLHDDLLPGELTRMHRAYATALEADPGLAPASVRAVQLAHHWYAARNNQAAFRWSVKAARLQHYGYAEALRHYERALELWEVVRDPESEAGPLPEFLDEAADVAGAAGQGERAVAMLNEALRIAGPGATPEATALRLARKARMMLNLVQPGVLELVEEAVSLVRSDEPTRFRARLLDYHAMIRLLLDKPGAINAARSAIAAAQAIGDKDIESSARNTLGCALATLGIDVEEGLSELRTAGRIAVTDRQRVRYYINLSDTLTLLGHYAEAARTAAEGQAFAAEVGLYGLSGVVMLSGNAAEAAIALGDWGRARAMVEDALRTDPTGNQWIHQRRLLATITLWMDDDADAVDAILEDLQRFTQIAINGPQYHAGISAVRAELALSRNQPDLAWDIVRSTVESLPWREPGYDLSFIGVAALAYGRHPQRPAAWREWLVDEIRNLPDLPVADQYLPFITAELGSTVDDWRQAIETMTEARTPPHLIAYAHLRQAQLEAAAGLAEDSRRSVGRGRALARKLGLRLVLRWLDGLSSAADDRGVAADSSPLAALTTREREVLSLVADGLSNRQIGDRLVISAKTASVHVSNILAKLDVGSRGEAAARFRSVGP
ncbi:AAA family ATPase [Microlunatus sp. Gsoil 973]|uniref:helix-turn-helix transcriptional regulator n=1 Tax=Microlunatus sp. Gsoil 973 TaxID=2672569 RepID=UPI0018A84FF2|nr:AAA family ATPase [Microlunatus sp. Gsoil 973]